MRTTVVCATCANRWSSTEPPQFKPLIGELQDSGIVLARCPEGHESATVYDMRRYRVLLESATLALHDGYANESVSTFAAALERAHEFFVRVVLRARLVSSAQVDKVWKDVDSQSERQLGAFYFLWLVETGEHYPLDQRYPTIRKVMSLA